ncbi:ABC transporter permease [Natrinema pallidum]|uniref:Copper ABC transporter permease n=2 Tax=Natrinema pallidum TaxID=69527 RepID=L9YUU8_9EURY|nr:ABC transporter permease subunit [Natrinema pallidum]ELY76673.1 copper ABC transporter permease [Natrinema pallidum DSM 3751]QCW02943.1 ABC transporter permease [Natrinema pallidum]
MNTVEVARKDFLDVRRSKVIWLVLFIYSGFAGLVMYSNTDQWEYYDTVRKGVIQTLGSVVFVGGLLVPLVALVAAYLSIAGEMEMGSAKFLLGLPNTRLDVILGKFLSRGLVIVSGIVGAFVVVAGFLLVFYPVFPITPYLVMFGLLSLYAVAYVAVAIGVSASVSTKARAAAVGFGLYFVMNILSLLRSPGSIVRALHADLLGFAEAPVLYQFISHLVPSQALMRGLSVFNIEGSSTTPPPADAPFYVQAEFMPVILCGWIIVPLVVGYYRFRDADIS